MNRKLIEYTGRDTTRVYAYPYKMDLIEVPIIRIPIKGTDARARCTGSRLCTI